jgi:GR25 family glycosyltransferase involved in LPS biosynthesis
MEVSIISLEKTLNHPVQKYFPQATFFDAIDLRNETPQNLLEKNLITINAFECLQNGRKYHREISTSGAIGLILSFLQILKSSTEAILICEDDCVPSQELSVVINRFLMHSSEFDMVVFGPIMYERAKNYLPSKFKDFDVLNNYFWGNHAILFSPSGRQKVIKYLNPPFDVQLDAVFSRLALYYNFKILIQASGEPLARQSLHLSTVQNNFDVCVLCDTDTNSRYSCPFLLFVIFLVLFVFFIAK